MIEHEHDGLQYPIPISWVLTILTSVAGFLIYLWISTVSTQLTATSQQIIELRKDISDANMSRMNVINEMATKMLGFQDKMEMLDRKVERITDLITEKEKRK